MTHLHGFVENSANGIFFLISTVANLESGGRGKMFSGPGSWGPGMNTNRLVSNKRGKLETISPKKKKKFKRITDTVAQFLVFCTHPTHSFEMYI